MSQKQRQVLLHLVGYIHLFWSGINVNKNADGNKGLQHSIKVYILYCTQCTRVFIVLKYLTLSNLMESEAESDKKHNAFSKNMTENTHCGSCS